MILVVIQAERRREIRLCRVKDNWSSCCCGCGSGSRGWRTASDGGGGVKDGDRDLAGGCGILGRMRAKEVEAEGQVEQAWEKGRQVMWIMRVSCLLVPRWEE